MPDVEVTLSMSREFADKFIGFLHNLNAVNENDPVTIVSVKVEEGGTEYVAFPKEDPP